MKTYLRALQVLLLWAVTFAACERSAQAASFQVDPVLVNLSAKTTSSILAIRNLADEPVRVQLSAHAWNQTPTGEVNLTPTHDIVFFPSLLSLAPHELRNIRLTAPSALLTTTVVERSYRIVVEELLPRVNASTPSTAVRVITKMSIPLFIQPPVLQPAVRVDGLRVLGAHATFSVTNPGTSHFITHSVYLRVNAPDGTTLFDKSVGGWYVLARGSRVYDLDIPASVCTRGASITFEVETDKGRTVQRFGGFCTASGQ